MNFPYNIEYMMKNAIVDNNDKAFEMESVIEEYKGSEFKDKYKFNLKKNYVKELKLPVELQGKIVYVSFDMRYNQSCQFGDTYISINGVKNKLTCKEGLYHNKNKNFQYVISTPNSTSLKLEIGKGKYVLENVRVYYSPIIYANNESIKDLVIDKRENTITGNIDLDRDNYLITSIPYDQGFRVFVNDLEVNYELVNEAFLGFKLKKGHNDIRIEYKSLYFDISVILSLLGFGIFFITLVFEELNEKSIVNFINLQLFTFEYFS